MKFNTYAVNEPAGKLEQSSYDPGPLGDNEVEIKVEYCGICHSDLSMIDNEWGFTQYPFVGGHEIVGIAENIGRNVSNVKQGQRVGLGWFSKSCMYCEWCLKGDHNLCAHTQGVIVGRNGGFADKVRADALWAIALPDGMNAREAGPLFCGGITVFNPIVQFNIQPTDKVGVIGIGGLGHMALQFLNAWGCEVTAFSSDASKEVEAREMGAHKFINSRDDVALDALASSYDFILSTVAVSLEWSKYVSALRPKGKLHLVGAVSKPIEASVFAMMGGQKSISASPLGSPVTIKKMLEFSMRHNIKPIIEAYKFSEINEAIEKLRNGKPRYRLVLVNE